MYIYYMYIYTKSHPRIYRDVQGLALRAYNYTEINGESKRKVP